MTEPVQSHNPEKYRTDFPKCCARMKRETSKDLTSPPDDGVFMCEDGTLAFAGDGVWAATDVKFCPWCGKAVAQ